jgi:tetratricopeptide (TPR) repeat protein
MLADDGGKGKNELIVRRLLRYVEDEVADAVRSLAAARAFDAEIYHQLGKALTFSTSAAAFRMLIRFSFVWKASGRGDGWYRIHDLLRRLFRDDSDPVMGQAHAVLEEYFRRGSSGDGSSIAEAIYHANRREPKRGCEEWCERFDQARRASRYGLCRALLEVPSELTIPDALEQGGLSRCEGDYYAELALHDAAQSEYLEAIEAYDRALRIAPDDAEVHRSHPFLNLNQNRSDPLRWMEAPQSRCPYLRLVGCTAVPGGLLAHEKTIVVPPQIADGLASAQWLGMRRTVGHELELLSLVPFLGGLSLSLRPWIQLARP